MPTHVTIRIKQDAAARTVLQERLGYAVTTLTSSPDAFERSISAPDDFDPVLTDMTMPNMTGNKLASQLMNLKPFQIE